MKGTLIMIPAHNEAGGIGDIVREIRRIMPSKPVLVIDDGSSDSTAAEAKGAGALVLSHSVNRGYGLTLLSGYRYAISHDFDRVVQMDADGQHDPASIAGIVAAMDMGAELVLGSRFLHDESYSPPLAKRIGIKLFSAVAGMVSGCRITDATTGFQGLTRAVLRFYTCGEQFPHDYPDANMIIRVSRAGFQLQEVAVRMFAGPPGASMHSGWRPLWYIVKMFWMVCHEAHRRLPRVDEEEARKVLASNSWREREDR